MVPLEQLGTRATLSVRRCLHIRRPFFERRPDERVLPFRFEPIRRQYMHREDDAVLESDRLGERLEFLFDRFVVLLEDQQDLGPGVDAAVVASDSGPERDEVTDRLAVGRLCPTGERRRGIPAVAPSLMQCVLQTAVA